MVAVLTGGVPLDVNVILHGKKMFIKYIFLITLLIFSSCKAQELTSEETIIIDSFLRTLTTNSELGYVLHGKKPLCTEGFAEYPTTQCASPKKEVILREGATLWKKLFAHRDSNVIFCLYNHCDKMLPTYRHLLLIHRELFLKTVQEHLPLFQYALGPNLTPETLLKALTDEESGFNAVLKNDKELIGILLGFGLENSLYESRLENIYDSLCSYENPPFHRSIDRLQCLGDKILQHQQLMLLESSKYTTRQFPTPSFSFSSLQDEITHLTNAIEPSSKKLSEESPRFIFGIVNSLPSNKQLIAELEMVQDKTQKLNQSNNYLETVLKLIFPVDTPTFAHNVPKKLSVNLNEHQIDDLISRAIWEEIDKFDIQSVIQGMTDAHKGKAHRFPNSDNVHYGFFASLSRGFKRIDEANQLFSQLSGDPGYQAVIPNRVLFKVVENGQGDMLSIQNKATLALRIQDPEDDVLTDKWDVPEQIDISETLPAFALAIQGMKIGEKREIYIHPDYAYGLYTPLEKGIYLKCQVKLLDSPQIPFKPAPSMNIEPLDFPKERAFVEQNKEKMSDKIYSYDLGYKLWSHYKLLNMEWKPIRKRLESYHENPSHFKHLNEEDMQALNRLQWNIYQEDAYNNK